MGHEAQELLTKFLRSSETAPSGTNPAARPAGAPRPLPWQSSRPTNERPRGQSTRRVRGCRPRWAVQSPARAGINRTTIEPPAPLERMLARQKGPLNRRGTADEAGAPRQREVRLSAEKKRELADRYIGPALPSVNWRRSTASRPARCRTSCVVTGRRAGGRQSQRRLTPHPGRCVVSPGAHLMLPWTSVYERLG